MKNNNLKNLRIPLENQSFLELFHFVWNHGVGNEFHPSGDPAPWTDITLEAAFDTVGKDIDRRTIQNWRSGKNIPNRRNMHALARVVGGEDEHFRKRWADAFIATLPPKPKVSTASKHPQHLDNKTTDTDDGQSDENNSVTHQTQMQVDPPRPKQAGQKHTSSTSALQNTAKRSRLSIAVIIGIGGLFLMAFGMGRIGSQQVAPTKPIAEKTDVFVAGFNTRSSRKDVAAFGQSLSIYTLQSLGRIDNLRVIEGQANAASGSVNSAGEAQTAYMISGTVTEQNEAVTLSTRLVQSPGNVLVWSKISEWETLSAARDAQSKIADDLSQIINITVSPALQARMQNLETANLDAYLAYTKGRAQLKHWHEDRTQYDLNLADTDLRRALEFDKDWAEPRLHLVDIYSHVVMDDVDIRRGDDRLSPQKAEHLIQANLWEAAEFATLPEFKTKAESNAIFYSDDWTGLGAPALANAKLASEGQGELEWLYEPVILLLLGEWQALDNLIEQRILKFDPLNGTGHAYAVRRSLLAGDIDDAKARLKAARGATFSNRLDEVEGFIFFADNNAPALRRHIDTAESLSPLYVDYFTIMLAVMDGDTALANTVIEASDALAAAPAHKAFALAHSGYSDRAAKHIKTLSEQPLGLVSIATLVAYGGSCGMDDTASLRPLSDRLEQAGSRLPPC